MSNTMDIVCVDCAAKLWIGQFSRGRLHTYTYYRDKTGQRHLDRFLQEHEGHALRAVSEWSPDAMMALAARATEVSYGGESE